MVDVIIPTYNNYAELKKCLNALSCQTVQCFEVWIAVDGSSDETLSYLPQYILELPYKVHILEHSDKQNHGRSAARNLGLSYIKNQFVWLLDSDMIPEPNCLESHLFICCKYKHAVSVGAIYYENSTSNLWAKYISTRGHAKSKHQDPLPWNYFVTANSVVPARYFIELTGFDENIKKYGGEDMEFAYRMHLKYSPVFYKNELAVCKTIQNKTLSQALLQLEEYGREGLPYIYQKHADMPKVYHLDKLTGKPMSKKLYRFLTLPLWSKCVKRVIKYLPFTLAKHAINYLVISTVFKGYSNQTNMK
jgi:glycosyltransferase involved in cell wall biosynthesis